MKKKLLFFPLLFLVMAVFSQQSNKVIIYNLEKVVLLTSANEIQKADLKTALQERNNKLTNVGSNEKVFLVNKAYHKAFSRIFKNEQRNKVYKAQVNLEGVKQKAILRYTDLVSGNKFPKSYENILEKKIFKYENRKDFLDQKFFFNEDKKLQKLDSLTIGYTYWENTQKKLLREAQRFWQVTESKYERVTEEIKEDFIAYHFYIQQNKESNGIIKKIEKLTSKEGLRNVVEIIAEYESNDVLSIISSADNIAYVDTIVKQHAEHALRTYIAKNLHKQLNKYEPLELVNTDVDFYKKIVLKAIVKKQSEIAALEEEASFLEITKKAEKAGLEAERIQSLLAMIKKRDVDLKNYRDNKNASGGHLSGLFDNTKEVSAREIKNKFVKDLTKLISRKEFGIIFQDNFTNDVKQETIEQVSIIKESHKFTDLQLKEVYKIVSNYFYNEAIMSAYYDQDKTLRGQKLSALRYHFQKDYKKLMESFGIQIDLTKKVNNSTFLW